MLCELQVLNTIAIAQLDDGNHQHAAEVLLSGVSQMSWTCLTPTPIGEKQCESTTRNTMAVYTEEVTEASQRDFFSTPYHFEHDLSVISSEKCPFLSSEQFCLTGVTLMFNLSLCFHLKWDQQKNRRESSRLLLKALEMYEQAFTLLSYYSPTIRSQDPILDVLMSVCTNASHCNRELANLSELKKWNERLQYFVNCSQRGRISGNLRFFSQSATLDSFGWAASPAA